MTEGYGPNAPALLTLKKEGAGLVLTVDCGAAAVAPLAAAREAGLDVIVLDHHAVETLPPARAQVNPNQPGDTSGLGHLCAAGVTFLFLVALNRALREAGWYAAQGVAEPDLMRLLDLVGLATVCDVVPLLGVNRAFVRAGLARLFRRSSGRASQRWPRSAGSRRPSRPIIWVSCSDRASMLEVASDAAAWVSNC